MIRKLSQLSFSGAIRLDSGDTRVELIARNGRLEIHLPNGQGLLKLLSLKKRLPAGPALPLPLPAFFSGSIPVFVFGRPLLYLDFDPKGKKKLTWSLTPLKFLKSKTIKPSETEIPPETTNK